MDGIEGAATPVAASEELRAADTKACIGCGTLFERQAHMPAWNWNKRRFCTRQCGARTAAADPAWRERVSTGIRSKLAEDPAFRAQLIERATGQIIEASKIACRKKSGRTRSRRQLGWLPAEMQPGYFKMRELLGAAEARRLVKEEIAHRARRDVADVLRKQHERQARERAQAY